MHYDSDVLDDYLSHELAPAADAAVHAHLDTCADCRAAHEQAVALRDWIRAAAQAEEREFPAGISARVWAHIHTPAPTAFDRLRALWRPLVAIPVGALAVALAFVFGPLRPANVPQLRVAAAYYLAAHNAQAAENPFADRSTVSAAAVLIGDRSATLPLVDANDVTATDERATQ
jgi:anti-sigma factor RsiW